jgi:hypothetical protein
VEGSLLVAKSYSYFKQPFNGDLSEESLSAVSSSHVYFTQNKVTESTFNAYAVGAETGMFHLSNGVFGKLSKNRFESLGKYQAALPLLRVNQANLVFDQNTVSHLFCRSVCLL